MALETTPVQPANPNSNQSSPRHSARKPDGGANGGLSFAQLLRGQQESAAPEALPAFGGAQAEADAARRLREESNADSSEPAAEESETEAGARKLPKKQQLGAEDLSPDAMALKDTHTSTGDLLNRMLGAGRAQARAQTLNAERSRDSRRGMEGDAASASEPAANVAGLMAAAEPRSVDAAVAAVATTSALQAPQQGAGAPSAEGLLTSLAAPGEVVVAAPAPQPEAAAASARPDAYADLTAMPGTDAFPAELGAQLSTWMNEGVEYAMLELNPRELGPIDVRIALRDGSTRIELGSEVASTRAALAEALPQLAEALGEVGLAMSGGQVSDQAGDRSGQSDAQSQARQVSSWLRGGRDDSGGELPASLPQRPPVNPRALLDMYA